MSQTQNPFFSEFTSTPYGTAPFDRISVTDYEPAIDRGIRLGLEAVDAIVANPEPPTFENTIVALEHADRDLNRVLMVFDPLLSAMTDDAMMELSLKITPRLSDYSTSISLNRRLWERVKAVYDKRDSLGLDTEDSMLLRRTYESFVRSGALLEGDDRETYSWLSSRLSELTTLFGQNVLKELNTYEIWLTTDDLSGLPESSVEAAALAAKEKGREGEYLFTLAQPVYMAFMKYSDRRDLREKMYRLYSGRNVSGDLNNLPVMKEIAETRMHLAWLLGYETFAHYRLEKSMAKTPEKVYELLDSLRDAYRPAMEAELRELSAYASQTEGREIELCPWDYSYYANKLKTRVMPMMKRPCDPISNSATSLTEFSDSPPVSTVSHSGKTMKSRSIIPM